MINITSFLSTVAASVKDKPVPVVDLIAVQTKDPYKVLVATILSARTKDETTAKSAARLFKKAPDMLSLSRLSEKEIEKLIYPVGFFRNKADYLSRLPTAIDELFYGIIPDSVEELIKLPGVGRKTANLVVTVAFNKPAICVDTHVHRIVNIWKYVNTDTPLQTELALRKKLPADQWDHINTLLVAFGQSLCKPVAPHCDICPLLDECPQKGVTPRKTGQKTTNSEKSLSLISWNVNGIRAIEKKGFIDQINELDADIIALQETKAQPDQLSNALHEIEGYTSHFHSALKKGYSGVALYLRHKPKSVIHGLGIEEFDAEGRAITAEYENFFLVNCYFPNAGAGLKRLDFKLRFNQAIHKYVSQLAKKKCVLLCGDYNVAHKEIDLKNPKNNTKNAGFTPEERSWMDSFLQSDFIDTFRMFNKKPGQYSWWSYRFNARAKDIGWRIDYFCVDSKNKDKIQHADIHKEIMGSDHCPVGIIFTP